MSPKAFGGLGGCAGGRGRNPEDDFETAVDRAMGERLRAEWKTRPEKTTRWYEGKMLGHRLYGSITNQDWKHENGDTAGYSFRAAGDLISSIIGDGEYMDWYCSHPEGVVDPEVAELLKAQGWSPFDGDIVAAAE
jgi:hypothetical protein